MAVSLTRSFIEVSLRVPVPARIMWSVLVDTRTWPRWGPSVTAVQHQGARLRAGSRGRIRTPVGLWLPFEVTELVPGRAWSWRIGGVRATGHRVEPSGPHCCTVSFTVPWWAAPYVAVVRRGLRALERLGRERVAATERPIATGTHGLTRPETST